MQIELGERYVLRDGSVTGKMKSSGSLFRPWTDEMHTWRDDGVYWRTETDHWLDIVDEFDEGE